MSPQRIQLKRTKGWRIGQAVSVARPTKWGNPYRAEAEGDWVTGPDSEYYCAPGEAAGVAVRLFREALHSGHLPFTVYDVRQALEGRDLACWCRIGDPCHADVLLDAANRKVRPS